MWGWAGAGGPGAAARSPPGKGEGAPGWGQQEETGAQWRVSAPRAGSGALPLERWGGVHALGCDLVSEAGPGLARNFTEDLPGAPRVRRKEAGESLSGKSSLSRC